MEGQNQPITYSVATRRQRARLSKGKEKRPEESPRIKKGMGAEDLREMTTVGCIVGRGEWV